MGGCDIATLDFDIVAGTYVWLGDADKTVHFHFKQILPSVDTTTAVTTSKYDNSTDVWLATTFDAPAWLELLVGKLKGKWKAGPGVAGAASLPLFLTQCRCASVRE